MSANDQAPIIIKRKKVSGGDGHHGGAWKVAYADFVTAMMAFFMLMWLLNATTETQRKGIADYFSPTIPINRISGGGDGAFGGDSVFAEETLAQNGIGASAMDPSAQDEAKGDNGLETEGSEDDDSENLSEIEAVLAGKSGESNVSELMQRHIITKVTDEGLIIELHDIEGSPLFFADTKEPTPVMVEIIAMLSEIFAIVPNKVAIVGHTRSRPVVVRENPVWQLSTARANEVREMFGRQDLPADRILRVTGYADQKPVVDNPMATRNERVEVILLRSKR